jgi:hypothetical protein
MKHTLTNIIIFIILTGKDSNAIASIKHLFKTVPQYK